MIANTYPLAEKQEKLRVNRVMVSLLTVHTWVWDATSSLPGQGSVALDGACD